MAVWLNHFYPIGHRIHTSGSASGFSYLHQHPTCLDPTCPFRRADLPYCVPSSLHISGTGILTSCPSPTPFGLGLGPTNPTRINLPSETLGLRGTCFSHVLRYSCQHSHFCRPQLSFRSTLYLLQNALLPFQVNLESVASVLCLSPVTFSAQERLTSELLRTL